MKEVKLEKKLNKLKKDITPREGIFKNFLETAVTTGGGGRYIEKPRSIVWIWSYRSASVFATLLIFAGFMFMRSSQQDILALDVTDLEYVEIESSLELDDMDWSLDEELSILDLELKREML